MARSSVATAFLLASVLASSARAGTIYVNIAQTTGANDGTSWADAFQGVDGVQSALTAAVVGDQIWVAQGLYKPTAGTSRTSTLSQPYSVDLYGGFVGTETVIDQRDWVAHPTILSGDLNDDDGLGIYTDNSFHVLTESSNGYVLDGFTVQGGNADGPSASNQDRGGGLFSDATGSPTNVNIRHCIFRENRAVRGGACYVLFSNPIFTDCRFEANVGGSSGGAICTDGGANTRCRSCVFTGNSAGRGGAIEIVGNSQAKITNCVLWNNTATGLGGGGGIFIDNAPSYLPEIRQCTIWGNHSSLDPVGGVVASAGTTLANDIIYSNDGPGGAMGLGNNVSGTCAWCCVQGIAGGAGNIAADPLLSNPAAGDFHISQFSPCADAGNNGYVPSATPGDFDQNPRIADDTLVPDTGVGTPPIVDMGAYEVQNSLYTVFCAGDGTLVTPCPCGNSGAAGRGCANSTPSSTGARLAVAGVSTPDNVVLNASGMLPSVSCIFLQSDVQDPNGFVFGDGVRCVTGSIKRMFVKTASAGSASAPGAGDPSVSARSASRGDPIAPGSLRYYQVYYRDPAPSFCPAPAGDDWNVTNGAIVSW